MSFVLNVYHKRYEVIPSCIIVRLACFYEATTDWHAAKCNWLLNDGGRFMAVIASRLSNQLHAVTAWLANQHAVIRYRAFGALISPHDIVIYPCLLCLLNILYVCRGKSKVGENLWSFRLETSGHFSNLVGC